jgi:hypothetical protein
MKYAFVMNSGTLNPENYSVLYEDEGNCYFFTAVSGMDMTRALVMQLAEDGYELIDLCGDYDEEKAQDISNVSGGKLKVNYARYSEEELEKFNALPSNDRYGILVLGFDLSKDIVRLELTSSEYNTYISIVAEEESAVAEAKRMQQEGIHFIELCGYFNAERAEKIRKAVGYKLPIGYCGI